MRGASSELEFLRSICRIGPDPGHESFENYWGRVEPLLPNVPRCVAENWLHRHWPDFRSRWSWLAIRAIEFEKQQRSAGYFLENVRAIDHSPIEGHARSRDSRATMDTTYLGQYMERTGTWPVPVIVLPNPETLDHVGRSLLPRPVTLVEGHRRLRCLLGRSLTGRHVQSVHDVWMLKPDPRKVLKRDPWPDWVE